MSTIIALLVASASLAASAPELMDGDIVFHQSRSRQAPAVRAATGSPLTHTGILFHIDGVPHVLEAVAPSSGRVGYSTLRNWRSRGQDGKIWIKRLVDRERLLTPQVLGKMRRVGHSFQGRPYDRLFGWGTDKLYCSELVYNTFLVGSGISLGRVQQIRDLNLKPKPVKELIRARIKNNLDLNDLIITPVAIFDDPRLRTVAAP